eukprot:748973-Hanusia_phi.AAC.2
MGRNRAAGDSLSPLFIKMFTECQERGHGTARLQGTSDSLTAHYSNHPIGSSSYVITGRQNCIIPGIANVTSA